MAADPSVSSVLLDEWEVVPSNRGRARISHIGLPGDRQGLCGTPTKGIPATPYSDHCVVCDDLWANMTDLERQMFRNR